MKRFPGSVLLSLAVLASCGEKEAPKQAPPPPRTGTPRSIAPMSLKAWTPPVKMPEPKERITGEEWEKHWKDARAKLDLKALEKEAGPPFSLYVHQVFPNLQADQAGVKSGDHILSFQGKAGRSYDAFVSLRRDAPGLVKFWSPTRGYYELNAKAGKLGLQFGPWWRPQVAYVRSAERDPKWDEFVGVATLYWNYQGDVAETALFHAFRAGYRGWLLPALMTRIAYENGRPSECMNYGWFAKDQCPEDQACFVLQAAFVSGVLLGQLDWARALDKERPLDHLGHDGWDGGREAQIWNQLGEQEKGEPSPCSVAASGRFAADPIQAFDFNSNRILQLFRETGRATFNLNPPSHFSFAFGPGSRNVDFIIELDAKPFTPPLEGSAPECFFHLVRVENRVEDSFASLYLSKSGGVRVWGPDLPFMWSTGRALFEKSKHRIELAVRGRFCELRVNDEPYYLGTVEDSPSRRVVCKVKLANVTGEITRLEVTPLDAPKEAAGSVAQGVAPAGATPLRIPPKPDDSGLVWYHQAMVEGYLAQGRRSPAWDQPAVDGLALFCAYLRAQVRINLAECAAVLGKAIESGCDDPLVRYAHALTKGYVDWRSGDSVRGMRRAAEGIRTTKYSPGLKCYILSTAGIPWGATDMEENRRKNEAFEQDALALLAEALDEENAPGSLLLNAMLNIGRYHSEGVRDVFCGFERVSQEAAKAKKGSAVFLGYKGYFYVDYAWQARGGGWAKSVSEEGWKLFRHRLQVAAESLEQSWKEDPTNPRVPARMISVALGQEKTRADVMTWVDRSLKASPNNEQAVQNLLWFSAPRWFGTDADVLQIGRNHFARAKREHLDPGIGLLLLSAHAQTVMPGSFQGINPVEEQWQAEELWRSAAVWKDVVDVFTWILEEYPESAYFRSLYAAFASHAERWGVAKEQFLKLGDRLVPGAFKSEFEARQMKARALASE